MIHFCKIWPSRWLYWGHEDQIFTPMNPVDPFWFIEENSPHRIGNGWRFKETPTEAWHIGLARKGHPPLEARTATPEEIGTWGHEDLQEEAEEAGTGQVGEAAAAVLA